MTIDETALRGNFSEIANGSFPLFLMMLSPLRFIQKNTSKLGCYCTYRLYMLTGCQCTSLSQIMNRTLHYSKVRVLYVGQFRVVKKQ